MDVKNKSEEANVEEMEVEEDVRRKYGRGGFIVPKLGDKGRGGAQIE